MIQLIWGLLTNSRDEAEGIEEARWKRPLVLRSLRSLEIIENLRFRRLHFPSYFFEVERVFLHLGLAFDSGEKFLLKFDHLTIGQRSPVVFVQNVELLGDFPQPKITYMLNQNLFLQFTIYLPFHGLLAELFSGPVLLLDAEADNLVFSLNGLQRLRVGRKTCKQQTQHAIMTFLFSG